MIADHGGPLIRLVALAVALALILSLVWIAFGAVKSRLGRRMPRLTPRQRYYDWEPRTEQIARQLKVGAGPAEDRDRILAFLDSRTGVEAFVEPRTVMHPLSVVLVAGDGEWVRIELRDDRFLRELARSRGLRVQDATRVGYPERNRRPALPASRWQSLGGPGLLTGHAGQLVTNARSHMVARPSVLPGFEALTLNPHVCIPVQASDDISFEMPGVRRIGVLGGLIHEYERVAA